VSQAKRQTATCASEASAKTLRSRQTRLPSRLRVVKALQGNNVYGLNSIRKQSVNT
jgi:hypothetical protein